MNKFRTNLRVAIKASPYSQREIARQLDLSVTTLQNWLKGKADPNAFDLARLCKLIECSMDRLFDNNAMDIAARLTSIDKRLARLERACLPSSKR